MEIIQLSSETDQELIFEQKKIGVHPEGIRIMTNKGKTLLYKIYDVPVVPANIIKQEMLSLGGDSAQAHGTIDHSVTHTDVILIGNQKIYLALIEKLKNQAFKFLRDMGTALDNIQNEPQKLFRVGNRKYLINQKYIMGIINVTPDSFYQGSRKETLENVTKQAKVMISEGADFLDIGAESSRPGANKVSASEEIERLSPIIRELRNISKIPLSIDTYKSEVASFALENGVDIVNDISGLDFDPEMGKTIAKFNATAILMHIKGTPKDMQANPKYDDVIKEVYSELKRKKDNALKSGITNDKIILDIGIGFGKRVIDNYTLIRRLKEFKALSSPMLLGLSRKSLIGEILKNTPEDRLNGTTVLHTLGLNEGASILRVHDVKAAKETVKLFNEFEKGYFNGKD
jgi:dihydropteroate synthase